MKLRHILLFVMSILATGCATHAQYPVASVDQGEWVLGGHVSGDRNGAVPTLRASARTGTGGFGDVGAHAGWESLEPGFAAGLSYRLFLAEWVRFAVDATHHFSPGKYEELEPGDDIRAVTGLDDWTDAQALVEFAYVGDLVGVHGGPVAKTGLWYPDAARTSDGARWLGATFGAMGGIAIAPRGPVSVQLDAQFLPGAVAEYEPPGDTTCCFLRPGALETTLSVFVRF